MTFCFYGDIYSAFCGFPAGGGEKQLSLIIKELSRQQIKVYVIDLKCDKIIRKGNVIFIPSQKVKNNYFKIPYLIVLYNLLFHLNYDYCFSRIRGFHHFVPLLITLIKRKKFIYSFASDLDGESFKQRYKYFYKQRGLKYLLFNGLLTEVLFSFVLRFSSYILIQYSEQYFSNKSTIINFPNLYEIKEEDSFTKTKNTNSPLIYIGSIDERKGANELFELISTSGQEVNFLIIGSARDTLGTAIVNKIKSFKNVEYVKYVNNNEIIQKISGSRALISTSKMEGFPNVFLESWYAGIPVISLYVNPGNVLNKHNLGVCCDGNINTMANEILIIDKNKYDSKAIHDYVVINHNSETVIKHLLNSIS